MTRAIDQLAELVRQAEAKTRARKIEGETLQVAEQFRLAEQQIRSALERHRVARSVNLRILEQANTDEQLLKELVRKLALYKSSLSSQTDAEKLITASQSEIERARSKSRAELEQINHEVDHARRELRVAIDAYRQLRRELDRLQPELSAKFLSEDRLLWDAEAHFPGGQLQLLANEVDVGQNGFAALGKLEQYARLKVWIGRFRFFQASHDHELEMSEELQSLSHRVFHQLKWLSRQYEPGYIEAFRQDFSTDWSVYVAEAQEQLVQAVDAYRRARDIEVQLHRDDAFVGKRVPISAPDEFPRVLGLIHCPASTTPIAPAKTQFQATKDSLVTLKAIVARICLPEGQKQFLDALRHVVDDLGTADPEVLRLVLPYREYINGEEGLNALSRNLDRIHAQKSNAQSCDAS
jgi:hypothetical protein